MRPWIFLFFFVSGLMSLPFIYTGMTHGFRVSNLYAAARKSDPCNLKPDAKLLTLFHQPFHYLGKGMQFFVFESEDHQIVIKLFRRPKKAHRVERLEKTFQACRLAFELAKEETGLLFIHLSPTSDRLPILSMRNRLGFPFSLSLDSCSFVVQKKAEPFFEVLLQALTRGEADPLIDSYLNLIFHRSSKGICNTDFLLKHNFGFLGSQAIEIDFGNYLYDPENKEHEFRLFAHRMRRFLKKHAPDYLPLYEQKVASFL
jgi:hypothetical protein